MVLRFYLFVNIYLMADAEGRFLMLSLGIYTLLSPSEEEVTDKRVSGNLNY